MSKKAEVAQPEIKPKLGLAKLINYGLCFVFVVLVAFYMKHISRLPVYNSDLLPYMGVVLESKGLNKQQIHQQVYTIARQNIPDTFYNNLINLNEGRIARFNDANAFYDYFRFFRLKPLYILSVKTFSLFGANLVLATVLPSLFFVGALLCAFYFALYKRFSSAAIPFGLGVLVMLFSSTNQLALLSSPDGISSFFVFLLFLNVFFSGKEWHSYLLFALAILARIDNAILLPFLIFFYRFNHISFKTILKSLSVLFVAALVILCIPYLLGNNFFWFEEFIFSPKTYTSLASKSLRLMRTDFNLLLLLSIIIFYVGKQKPKELKFMMTAVLAVMLFRFILFPSYEERFFFVFKLMIIFILIASYGKVFSNFYIKRFLNAQGATFKLNNDNGV